MKFGPINTLDAVGTLLAHSIAVQDGRLKKGQRLSQVEVDSLVANGHDEVIVARLESDDVEENDAATRLAKLLGNAGVEAEPAFTGRANLHARQTGIFEVNSELVNAINRVDPSITLATLPDDTFVEAGRMVATVKIIPLAVSAGDIATAEMVLNGAQLLGLNHLNRTGSD